MDSTQITTVTFFTFDKWKDKIWAFSQMRLGASFFANVEGLQVFKLMGTGAGSGFSAVPDFSTYCLLAIWKRQEDAQTFFEENAYAMQWHQRAIKHATIGLEPTKARGKWSGQQPFELYSIKDENEKMVVLTRATIKTKRILEFWRYVPRTSRAIQQAKGVIFMKGVGELPWIQQATISVWENGKAMKAFAYQNVFHKTAIHKTYERDWYEEELFAEFQIIWTSGNWQLF